MKKSNVLAMALAALFAGMAADAQAASTYTFNNITAVPTNSGDAWNMTGVAGFAAANGGTFANNTGTNYGVSGFKASTTSTAGAVWAASALSPNSGGLGMKSDQASDNVPNHALDNGPYTNSSGTRTAVGNTEAVMLSFADSVVLSQVNFEWARHDADFSVFRYTGTTPPPTLAGVGLQAGVASSDMLTQMSNAGWQLVGNYNYTNNTGSTVAGGYTDAGSRTDNGYSKTADLDTATASVNSDGVGSSWWLISAYNSNYGTVSKNGGTLDQGDDYFKLYSVKVSNCVDDPTKPGKCRPPGNNDVPEPGSLALVSLGMLGLAAQYRRRRGAQA